MNDKTDTPNLADGMIHNYKGWSLSLERTAGETSAPFRWTGRRQGWSISAIDWPTLKAEIDSGAFEKVTLAHQTRR